MSFRVEVSDLTLRYGRTTALDGASHTVEPGTICGLLGRNGSGKTSLLSVLAGFRRPTSGRVLVDGEPPWENARVMAGTCLVREAGDVPSDVALKDTLGFLADVRPHFDAELAGRMLDTFELDPRRQPGKLSRGKKSAFGAVVGLASRAELTIFDEVYLGMDAPSRYAFYDALLADYVEHPRTIILSSHLIDEVQRLLETVVLLDHGKVLLAEDADTLRARGVTLTGPVDEVERLTAGRTVLSRTALGRTAQVTVDGRLSDDERTAALAAGLELGPVDLQTLVIHLTSTEAVR